MTLSFRNGLLTFLLIAAVVAGALDAYLAVLAGQSFGWHATVPVHEQVLFWFWKHPASHTSLMSFVWQELFLMPVVIVGLFYLRILFRKTSAPEVFFFAFFLFSLVGESFRVSQVFFVLNESSFFWGIALTRTVWSLRLFGLFMLFAASLFTLEFNYQKFGNFVGLSLGLALFLGVNLTIQTTVLDSDGLYSPGDERGLAFIFIFLGALALVSFSVAAFLGKKSHGLSQLAAAVLFLIASQMTYFCIPWAPLLLLPALGLLENTVQQTYL